MFIFTKTCWLENHNNTVFQVHQPSHPNCAWTSSRKVSRVSCFFAKFIPSDFCFQSHNCCLLNIAVFFFSYVFQGEDGDFLWDEQVFLMVDNLEQQQLLVQLQERHTWHDDRAFAHQAILGKKRGQLQHAYIPLQNFNELPNAILFARRNF